MSVINSPEDTGIRPDSQSISESQLTPGSGIVTPAGKPSIQMVDLYSLPVRDLVAEIQRLAVLLMNSENEVAHKHGIIVELEQDVKALKQINEIGRSTNRELLADLKKQNPKQLIRNMRYQLMELLNSWFDSLERTDGANE